MVAIYYVVSSVVWGLMGLKWNFLSAAQLNFGANLDGNSGASWWFRGWFVCVEILISVCWAGPVELLPRISA